MHVREIALFKVISVLFRLALSKDVPEYGVAVERFLVQISTYIHIAPHINPQSLVSDSITL